MGYCRRHLLGLTVCKSGSEKELARVKDVVLDLKTSRAIGVALESDHLWQNMKYLPWENIVKITKRELEFYTDKPLKKLGKRREQQLAALWIGQRLFSPSGADWGTVADLVLNEEDWQIAGVYVSQGLWQDMSGGWQFLHWSDIQPVLPVNKR